MNKRRVLQPPRFPSRAACLLSCGDIGLPHKKCYGNCRWISGGACPCLCTIVFPSSLSVLLMGTLIITGNFL